MTNTEQPKKKLTVITYIIALVCLVLGLLLPNHDGKMMITTLPSAFAELFSALNITSVPGNTFTSSVDVNFFGLITLDIGALAILLYAVITVIGIIMLIPAFACKKKKPVSVCSYTVEIAAFIVLFIYVLLIAGNTGLTNYTPSDFANNFPFDWGVICIAFLGTLLMLLIQAIANYKGAGALKVVIWLLGMVGVYSLFTITGLSFIFSEEYGNLGGLFAVADGTHLSGYHFLYSFVQVTFSGNKAVYLLGTSGTAKAASIIIAIAALLAIINFIIDTFALSTKTKKSNVVFDCVRYLLEFVCALIGVILLFAIKEYKAEPGILLYVLVAVSVICADISIVRSAVYKKPKKEPEIAEPAESYYEDDFYGEYEPEPAPAPAPAPAMVYIPVYPMNFAPAPAAAGYGYPPAPAPAPAAPESVYKVKQVYCGPTDDFILKLEESEKIEFAKLFIEKVNGDYDNIPDYIVGGNNKAFFSALFIYLSQFRPLMSSGLMNKIYNELNLLNEENNEEE